ncbi:MAG: threonine dehydrogenase related Zn-dependent dehydrogenase [halophilic archaeon J07HB67]|nr:MAG: threonine dehydrogenase related Zn-dependent dehydrogenase [halophilic archaeon J07HB67]
MAVDERPTETVGDDQLRVETTVSGVSAGTELLVYRDEVPEEMPVDATLPAFEGASFDYPLAYGYAAVGRVVETGTDTDDDWLGRRVFGFRPHTETFVAEPSAVVPLPEQLSTTAAAMLPTVETAVTLVLDTAPRLGERVAVFGAGAVGLTTVALLAEYPLGELIVVEPQPERRERAAALGADTTLAPAATGLGERQVADEEPGLDAAVEISGNPAALDDAVAAVGYDGRVTVGSWYGQKRAELNLGGEYHRSRIAIEASQVSTLDPSLRGRWTTDRRLQTAVSRAGELPLSELVTHRVPFAEAPRAYDLLDDPDGETPLQVVFDYDV